jgi:hypothetical protein
MSGRMYHPPPRTMPQPLQQLLQCIVHAHYRTIQLTLYLHSPFPRSGEAVHPSYPRGPGPRDQGSLPAAHRMDRCDSGHLLGHEPDAVVRHCFFRSVKYHGIQKEDREHILTIEQTPPTLCTGSE